MRPHAVCRGIPTAALLLTLIASSPAASAPLQGGEPQPTSQKQQELAKLNGLLDDIRRLLESQVPAAKVEQRLKARTAHYRTIKGKVEDLAKATNPKSTGTKPVPTGIAKRPAKARLLSDAEKQHLADGTVIVVDGMELSEPDIRELAKYFASFKGGTVDDHITDALAELIVVRAMQAKFKDRLAEAQNAIASLRKRAAAGEDFATLAKEHSDGPSKTQGGDLGMLGRVAMVPSFARWAFSLSPGKISPVFASPYGYHILKVTERNKGSKPEDDQVRCSHILKSYSPDPSTLRNLIQRARSGEVDVACINDAWRKLLPQAYK